MFTTLIPYPEVLDPITPISGDDLLIEQRFFFFFENLQITRDLEIHE